jgi:hypothetical protein
MAVAGLLRPSSDCQSGPLRPSAGAPLWLDGTIRRVNPHSIEMTRHYDDTGLRQTPWGFQSGAISLLQLGCAEFVAPADPFRPFAPDMGRSRAQSLACLFVVGALDLLQALELYSSSEETFRRFVREHGRPYLYGTPEYTARLQVSVLPRINLALSRLHALRPAEYLATGRVG